MLDDLLDSFKRGRHERHGVYGHDHGRGSGRYAPMFPAAGRAIVTNKALLATLIAALIVIAALGVWLLMTLLSLSGPLLESLGRNGVKGIAETGLALLRSVWEGTGGQ